MAHFRWQGALTPSSVRPERSPAATADVVAARDLRLEVARLLAGTAQSAAEVLKQSLARERDVEDARRRAAGLRAACTRSPRRKRRESR